MKNFLLIINLFAEEALVASKTFIGLLQNPSGSDESYSGDVNGPLGKYFVTAAIDDISEPERLIINMKCLGLMDNISLELKKEGGYFQGTFVSSNGHHEEKGLAKCYFCPLEEPLFNRPEGKRIMENSL